MAQSQLAIIGTGLIGASVGLCLSGRKNRNYQIVGADRDHKHLRDAKRMGAIDRDVGSLEEAVENAGLIVIATPVLAAKRIIEEMTPYLKPGTVVTDVCSTKADIMQWADELLPEGVHFVGGHPMAGRETSGPSGASIEMFKGATWAVTPSPKAAKEAIDVVLGLVEAAGANALYIDPVEHDQYAAAVSHMPILLSVALFRMVRDSAGWEDAALLSGPAFKDLTRLASGDPTMSRDIVGTNREAVLHWLRRYRAELGTIEKAIELGGEPVKDLFESTHLDRETFMMNPPTRRRPGGADLPSAQDAMGRLFVGGLYEKLKEASNRPPVRRDDSELRRKLGVPDDD